MKHLKVLFLILFLATLLANFYLLNELLNTKYGGNGWVVSAEPYLHQMEANVNGKIYVFSVNGWLYKTNTGDEFFETPWLGGPETGGPKVGATIQYVYTGKTIITPFYRHIGVVEYLHTEYNP